MTQPFMSLILTSRGRQGPPPQGNGFSSGRAATTPCGSHGRPGPRCGGTRIVRREEKASDPGDGHQGQVSPGMGRTTPPVLTETQQRGLHPRTGVAQGCIPPDTPRASTSPRDSKNPFAELCQCHGNSQVFPSDAETSAGLRSAHVRALTLAS